MCGRFALRMQLRDPVRAWYEHHFGSPDPNDPILRDRYNIAPTQPVLTVTATEGGLHAGGARWGFDGPGGKPVFNARVESVETSPLWAGAWGRHHAVVPASGFYEWKGSGAARTPFYVQRDDDRPLLFAALAGGPPDAPCVSILTCPPNRLMAELHDRMPVVLEPDAVDDWLHPEQAGMERVRALAVSAPEVLRMHAVGKEVGDFHAEGPELVEPVRAWF